MSEPPLQPAAVRVPGSTSNLGAGFDCVGLAFQRYLTAHYEPADALSIAYTGSLAHLHPDESDIVVRAFHERAADHGVKLSGGRFRLHSDIPVARGLGSSAAATVAGLILADRALGRPLERATLLRIATAREGHPDNAAPALLGGLVAVARDRAGEPHSFPLALAAGIRFVYAAPELEVSTAGARAALPAAVPHALAVRSLGRTAALVSGLATGDPALLRLGLTDELHVPHRQPLIPHAGEAFAAAVAAGAWGATISGSGSGLIALCPPGCEQDVLVSMTGALGQDGMGTVAFIAEPDTAGACVLSTKEAPC